MLYPELFRSLESVRWNMETDVPWSTFDASRLSDEQARTIKMNAITEWSALPATEMFLRDNRHDSDFSAFMSVWFFEEQKHALVLMEYLRRFRPDLVPTHEELHQVRFEFDPAPALETLHLLAVKGLAHLTRHHLEPQSERLAVGSDGEFHLALALEIAVPDVDDAFVRGEFSLHEFGGGVEFLDVGTGQFEVDRVAPRGRLEHEG